MALLRGRVAGAIRTGYRMAELWQRCGRHALFRCAANRPQQRGSAASWPGRIARARMQQQTELVRKAAFEATPILVENKLFLSTPYNHVIALNPQDGHKLWEYDPHVDLSKNYSEVSSRGVSAWRDPKAKPGQPCRLRIFMGTLDGRLIALDGETGKPCLDFGVKGEVNLAHDAATATEWTGGYQVTSAPAIANDLVITGSSIADNWKVDTGRGIVRAFDARTGSCVGAGIPSRGPKIPQPRTGAGNAWSTLSVDPEEDLVFIPTGSAAPDYYGGIRKGDDKWANSVVALRASSGKFVWGFQVVHHDLWDYDVASQPTLFTWKDGTPAIVINTKMGHVFVLNRLTGAPLACRWRSGPCRSLILPASRAGRRSRFPRSLWYRRRFRRAMHGDQLRRMLRGAGTRSRRRAGRACSRRPACREPLCFPATWAG